MFGEDDTATISALQLAPSEIAAQASIIASDLRGAAKDTATAARELRAWAELACDVEAATQGAAPSDRRAALPVTAAPEGFDLCVAGSLASRWPRPDVGVVIYGDLRIEDPYQAPMIGVVSGPDGPSAGDGDKVPVTVRGVDGAAAPITVFQQVVLEDLGTVVAWQEPGTSLGVALYGRGYDTSRVPELVALADTLQRHGSAFELAAADLPVGYGEVYRGAGELMDVLSPGSDYEIAYRGPDHDGSPQILRVSGLEASEEAVDAVRFFATGLERTQIAGRAAIVGNPWSPNLAPALVTWREPDGLVVRVLGMGVEREVVESVAASVQDLDRAEWKALVNGTSDCYSTG